MEAGYASVDITPRLGHELSGYGYDLDRRATSILDPLYARVVILDDGDRAAALIQLDLLALSHAQASTIRAAIWCDLNLAPSQVLLHCTHTHSGPATRPLFGCGTPQPSWLEHLSRQIVLATRQALKRCKRVTQSHRFTVPFVDGFAHNRVGENEHDPWVRGAQLQFADEPPILIAQYACHPVTLGRNTAYSADYIGVTISALAQRGYRTLYLNGCSGDLNPVDEPDHLAIAQAVTQDNGLALAAVIQAGLMTQTAWQPGPLTTTQAAIPLTTDPTPRSVHYHSEGARQVERAWRTHLRTHESTATAEVQIIGCGDVLFVGLGAEVFTRYGKWLRAAAPDHLVLVAGTCNGVLGYIPTPEDARRYASTRGCHIYGMPYLHPQAGERWTSVGVDIIREIIR